MKETWVPPALDPDYQGLGEVTCGEREGLARGELTVGRHGIWLGGQGTRIWPMGHPRALTFRWGQPWCLGREQHVCVRIPGILAPEKVAVVTRVATGPPAGTGVLHAVNAEHCPGGRGVRPIKDLLPVLRVPLPPPPILYPSSTTHSLLATSAEPVPAKR